MLYGYGFKLGLKLLLRGRPGLAARLLICPVSYWRHAEYAAVLAAVEWGVGRRVLDVGSPKLLSLYLCKRFGVEMHATDLHDYFMDGYRRMRAAEGLSEDRCRASLEDGRRLSFGDDAFDAAYAISVVEHIAGDGDTECLRQIARVLKPGGRCVLTVPFAPQGRDEYRRADFYWAEPGERGAGDRGAEVFYQRRYDEQALRRRLIDPSGLNPVSIGFIGERVLTRARERQLADFLPTWSGPLHPLLARVCLTTPSADWRRLKKPLCAVVVLEKHGA